ncbi:hypothetical protein Tco_0457604 [Tanacetum coccineum]
MCRVLGHVPSLGTFRRFYVNSISNGWLSFSRRGLTSCCFSKKLDSLKGWNDHFFWIDASICPIYIPWYSDVSVRRDPLPSNNLVDFVLLEKLDNNRNVIRRYPETFLCLVGLSRSFDDPIVHPTLLNSDESDMGLLDFVKSADPFKVKTGERTLAEGEVSLITKTTDVVVAHSVQTICLVDHTIINELKGRVGKKKRKVVYNALPVKRARTGGVVISESVPTTVGKSPATLMRLKLQSGSQGNESGSASHPTKEFVSSSVTPTPERDIPEDSSSTQDMNVQMRRPPGRYVVVTSSFEHDDVNTDVSPKVKSPLPHADVEVENTGNVAVTFADGAEASSTLGSNARTSASVPSDESPIDDFYKSQTVDFVTTQNVYVPEWNITNDARINNHALCRNLLDHITPPGYRAALRNQTDARFLDCFNINFAQHVCMAFELRLRYEHKTMSIERFQKKFTESSAVIQQRDAEIVDLKARLERAEDEAAKNVELLGKVSALELVRGELDGKVSQLTADCDGLWGEVVGEAKMQEERDMDTDLYPHMLTTIAGRRWVVGHGFRLAIYKCASFVECQAALGKVISMAINKGIQQGLEVGIEHGKAGRSLAQVEAYDHRTEGKYVFVVSEFENVSFSLLEELEGLKDSLLALIMSALTLKDGHGDTNTTPEFYSSLGVADYQVSTLVHTGDEVPVTQPHDDLFDTSIPDGPANP